MSNVIIDKSKIDILANAISVKSGEAVTMTLDEMVSAVDGIETGGGGITPTGNIDITSAGVTDVTNYATATVPQAEPWVGFTSMGFFTENNQRKWHTRPFVEFSEGEQVGWMDSDTFGNYYTLNAIAKNTSVTPTESAQTIGGANYMMEGAVTVNAIPSNYVGSGITSRSSSDLTASGATVTAPSGYYASSATKTVASGTAGTPTATKSAVNNHAISVTPSVTNTTGYITGSTKTGTAVSVSASELVSGSQTLTENDTYDVTNLASVTVNVSGGGGSSLTVDTKTTTLSAASSSISFTGLSGNPTSFVVTSSADQTTGGTKVVAVVYDGTSCHGIDLTTQAEADTGFTQSYSSGTLTITATTASFQANEYKLVYTYGGTSSNIATADVQVGSGATSITFTGLDDEPDYFSCIFKSTFSTSSGYQRVMEVVYDGTNTYGHALDSSAKALTSWSYSYNNGTLVISSTGTNNGGYFHQPGYYQLTYAIGGDQTLQKKTATPTSSDQTITADTAQGYTALKQVVVEGVTCSNLTAANIKSGVTVKIGTSTDDDSVTSVTGTYTGGGGGGSKNVQVLQSTSRTNASSLTKVLGDLTVATTGTYDIYWSGGRTNTSTSYTWGTRLYVDGTGYGTENTTWTNNCQSNHLSNVSLTANQKLSVYARGRTGSYYTFAPMLVIIEA